MNNNYPVNIYSRRRTFWATVFFALFERMTLSNEERRNFIVGMTRDAWNGYLRYAWPHDMLRPVTKDSFQGWFGPNSGETIVNAMSTLWLMDLRVEFALARRWLETEMNFEQLPIPVKVFQAVSEYLGGLLSCHALTGDALFLEKAHHIGRLLEPAYRTLTGIPYEYVNPKTGVASGTEPYLSYLGTGFLEYAYLSELTGDAKMEYRMTRIRTFMKRTEKPKGLLCEKINSQSGAWCSQTTSMFGAGRDYYGALVKRFLQSGRRDLAALEEFRQAIQAAATNGLIDLSRSGLVYVRNYDHQRNQLGDFMNQTGCYLGASLALETRYGPKKRCPFRELLYGSTYGGGRSRHLYSTYQRWQWAKQLTETFHEASKRTVTGLPPRNFYFDHLDDATNSRLDFKQYYQRPEIAESYFILYRVTGDERYREYAWQLACAIERHCRLEDCGFVELQDTTFLPVIRGNHQYAEFIGATLKYLYLIFSDDSLLPLYSWIFNSSGHPLPISAKTDTTSNSTF